MNTSLGVTPPAAVLEFRRRFPIFERRIHLASNSMGALAGAVAQAHEQYLEDRQEHGASWHLAVPRHEELRAAFAELIGAGAHEVALCFSATQALGAVASGLTWRDRPAVVFDDFGFPSVTHLWHAQARNGAEIRRVGPDGHDLIDPMAFDRVLDERVRLVSVAHGCYKNGHRLDLPAVAERAHDVGAWLVVDDYHVTGTRRLDVRASGIDVLVTGTAKYLLGSAGVGLLYVREELLDTLHPTVTGWFGQADPDAFQIDRHVEAPGAARFQSGTPAFPAIYGSLAGLQLIRAAGLASIERWVDTLTALLVERLEEQGFVSATPSDPRKRCALVAIRSHDAERVVGELARRGIVVSSRDGNVRTGWHYYNTPEDIAVLLEALGELRELMVTRD